MDLGSLSCLTPEVIALLQRHNLLETLIKAELVAQELTAVSIEPEQQNQVMLAFRQKQGLIDDHSFNNWLQVNQLTPERLLEQLLNPARLERFCRERFGHRAEMRFLERKHQLDQVVYSLIRVQDPFKAREFYLQISEGETDFGTIAAQYSEGHERNTRGVVGPVPLMQAHPKVVELLRSSLPGELREPVQIENWNLLLRLETMNPAVLDQDMELRMAQELFGEWIDEQVRHKLGKILANSSPVMPSEQA